MTKNEIETEIEVPTPEPESEIVAPRRRRFWRFVKITCLVLSPLIVWVTVDLGGSLLPKSQDSYLARTAEWARNRGLGSLVNLAESVVYELNPPQEGGAIEGGIPEVGSQGQIDIPGVPHGPDLPKQKVIAPPPPMKPYASPALKDEGQWQILAEVNKAPAIRVAYLRPDKVHTSFLTGVTITDQNLVRFQLHPGTEVPGGRGWGVPPIVPKADRPKLLATFNSGFLMKDSMGGYWQNGKSVGELRNGAASMVFFKDGRIEVGKWGTDVKMSGEVTAVRQNLSLLVDGGEIVPEAKKDGSSAFGATLGNAKYVWRSGIGIRADGSIVEVCGDALSVLTLATLLKDAGAVRAMTLDINKHWTSYITYTQEADGKLTAKKLTKDQFRDPYRHLEVSTRDFVAVYARP